MTISAISAEVWDFRVYDTDTPGLRCFGRFAGKDTFIALSVYKREDLDYPGGWDFARDNCLDYWEHLFGAARPFVGAKLDEYLSQPFDAV